MANDLGIQRLITITSLLISEEPVSSVFTQTQSKIITNNVRLSSNEITNLSQNIKSKSDLSKIFKEYKLKNGDIKTDLLEEQNEVYIAFIKRYPELGTLKKPAIERLLMTIFDKANKILSPQIQLLKTNNSNLIRAVDTCTQTWAKIVDRAETIYALAMIGVWAEVAIAGVTTAGLAILPVMAAAFSQTAVLYLAKEFTIDWATEDFFQCIATEV